MIYEGESLNYIDIILETKTFTGDFIVFKDSPEDCDLFS